MSDFIYSKKVTKPGKLAKEIKKIYTDEEPQVEEFHGNWGSLAVSQNLYNGFLPFENQNFIFIVIGGPVLYFRDNNFLNENSSNLATKQVFNRWKKGIIKWDEDLSGPFAIIIINKKTGSVEFITDIMSFIPIYYYNKADNLMLSTHIDVLANISGKKEDLDIISCADFVLHGIVTFPYTLYKDIYQVTPATINYIEYGNNNIQSHPYWAPKEEYKFNTLQEASSELKTALENYVYHITSNVNNIAQFISGGEDSRVLSGLLQEHSRDAFIFLDYMNREGKMAEKAANIYGATFNLATRSKTHYIEILPDCADLVGSGAQYHHAHTFGFHKSCNFKRYSAVFGGLFSDALLKGARIKKTRNSTKFVILGEKKDNNYTVEVSRYNDIFKKEIIDHINSRRRKHLKFIKQFRKESAEEWFELWPSSMNFNIPNIHVNRRLFRSYEPFMSNDVVKISASVPQSWKMNRRLFRNATKSLLKPSKWVFHTDGRLPYFPWYINSPLEFIYKLYRKIGLVTGVIRKNQGPWGEWKVVLQSKEWEKAILDNYIGFQKISSAFKEKDVKNILKNDNIHHLQRVNLMQVLYGIRKIYTQDY